VAVLASRHRLAEAPPGESVQRRLHLESPDLARYHASYLLRRAGWVRRSRRAVRRAVAASRADVAFVHGMWNLPVEVAAEAEALLPGRVVYWVASHWPVEVTAAERYWRLEAVRPWLRLPKRIVAAAALRRLPRGPIAARLELPRVLCVSRFIRDQIADAGVVAAERLFVVHNGVDVERFGFLRRDTAARPLRLLYAGRLSPDKGVGDAVEALARLREQAAGSGVRLSIVGGGDAGYEAALERRIRDLGLGDAVAVKPWVAAEEMPSTMAEHDVLLLPSVWDEPLARVAEEAMAAGLVVVATATGGTGELVEDLVTGLVVPASDPSALAAAVLRLAADPGLRERLAAAGRRRVEASFSEDRMIAEMEAHLAEVAA
ncbi:MAG: glycosyltransferase family 4 protein, partial [Thermoanaerobaculia bacterium]|nr:glycosyltransferase family 4 protein [Thermoanaerobaculia bacterium]